MIHYTYKHTQTHQHTHTYTYINSVTLSYERQYMAVSVCDIWSVFFCTPGEFGLSVQYGSRSLE